ncbi:MAG TPA: HDOD domain-containing protein [Opitutaceae bacterium]|nr:HDOD domain-containing protein [Opitutaceae bacterium]
MPASALLPAHVSSPAVDTLLQPTDLEAYAREMPIATTVLPRLQSLLQAEDTSISDIVDLIMLDPGLAVRVVQAAGSVRFGHGRPATSLAEALLRLGAEEVYRVTAAFALSRFLNRPLRCYGLGPSEFWRQSIACALTMVDLAPASGLDTRTAYTVGLLHATGMVFIDRHLRCVGAPNLRFASTSADELPRAEVALTGMHHARAAAFVLRAWGFGEEIVEPVEHQLRPGGSLRHREMTSLLAESRTIAGEITAKLPPTGAEPARPLRELLPDDWRAALAERILAFDGGEN